MRIAKMARTFATKAQGHKQNALCEIRCKPSSTRRNQSRGQSVELRMAVNLAIVHKDPEMLLYHLFNLTRRRDQHPVLCALPDVWCSGIRPLDQN